MKKGIARLLCFLCVALCLPLCTAWATDIGQKTYTAENGNKIYETYSPKGLLESVTTWYQENGVDYQSAELYDENGVLTGNLLIYEEDGKRISENYTAEGLLFAKVINDGTDKRTEYYDENGALSDYVLSYEEDGKIISEAYTAEGLLRNVSTQCNTAEGLIEIISTQYYTYTAEGLLESVSTWYQENGIDYTRIDYYDKNGKLTESSLSYEEGGKSIFKVYDADGTLIDTIVY